MHEGAEVLISTLAEWRKLPAAIRSRVSLVSIPMDDVDQNATIVNAIQRQATVVTQKSLAEGFGLTVAEAMWKAKPVVAAGVDGIQDQITDEQGAAARRSRRPGCLRRCASPAHGRRGPGSAARASEGHRDPLGGGRQQDGRQRQQGAEVNDSAEAAAAGPG